MMPTHSDATPKASERLIFLQPIKNSADPSTLFKLG